MLRIRQSHLLPRICSAGRCRMSRHVSTATATSAVRMAASTSLLRPGALNDLNDPGSPPGTDGPEAKGCEILKACPACLFTSTYLCPSWPRAAMNPPGSTRLTVSEFTFCMRNKVSMPRPR